MMTSRSASTSASSGSWVTSRVAPGVRRRGGGAARARVSSRVRASSAASGSSSSSSVGSDGQRPGQRDPLRLPAGQLPGLALRRASASPTRSSQSRGLRPRARRSSPAAARAERDVVQRGQVREQQVVLEHHADRPVARAATNDRAVAGRRAVSPVEARRGRAVSGMQPGQRAQRGGLAGAVRAEQRHHLARRDAQRRGRGGTGPGRRRRCASSSGWLTRWPASQRSRRPARTTTETTSSTRLSTIAASRSVSSAR